MSEFDAQTYFQVHEGADECVGKARKLAFEEDSFGAAQSVYNEALDMLSREWILDEWPIPDVFLQKAQIFKAKGGAYRRQALAEYALYAKPAEGVARIETLLAAARDSLKWSLECSEILLDYPGLSPEARKYIFSEHGDTISKLGEQVTIWEVMNSPQLADLDSRDSYENAHQVLLEGLSRRVELENAIRAARSERCHGRWEGTLRWLIAAYFTASEVEREDKTDGEAFKGTFWEQFRDLITKERARRAILQNTQETAKEMP